MSSPCDYYEILGVTANADNSELRSAFRRLTKELHPDTTSIPENIASPKFQQVCEAYDVLSDPVLRANYDLTFVQGSRKRDDIKNKSTSEVYKTKGNLIGMRRSLSGGELFSLTLLAISILLSMLLGVGFALFHGKELFVMPSWMIIFWKLSCYYLQN